MKVLVVCHGNICRSPLVAGILSTHLEVRQGGFAEPKKCCPPKIRRLARDFGFDLDRHRSRRVEAYDIRWANIILYMDSGNHTRLISAFPDARKKSVCLARFVGASRIPDPNFLKEESEEFRRSMLLLQRATYAFIETTARRTTDEILGHFVRRAGFHNLFI